MLGSQMPVTRLHALLPIFVLYLISFVDISRAADRYKIQAIERNCGGEKEFLTVYNLTCNPDGPYVKYLYVGSENEAVWETAGLPAVGLPAVVQFKQSKPSLLCKGYLSRPSQECDSTYVNMYNGADILANKNIWVLSGAKTIKSSAYNTNIFYIKRKPDPSVPCSGDEKFYLSYSNVCTNKTLSLVSSSDYNLTRFKLTLIGGNSTTKAPTISTSGISALLLKYTVSPPTFGEAPFQYRVCNSKINTTCADCQPDCKNIKETAPFTRPIATDFTLACGSTYQMSVVGTRPIGTVTPTAFSRVYASKPCIVDG